MFAGNVLRPFIGILIVVATGMLSVPVAQAHCDGVDGPVVKAARNALETGNVNLALIWVRQQDEGEITAAFQQTLAVRKLGIHARALADQSFFETLVRIHRAGEGAPFTGLKPAGQELGPAIPAADKALGSGRIDPLQDLLTKAVQLGLREHFAQLRSLRNYATTWPPGAVTCRPTWSTSTTWSASTPPPAGRPPDTMPSRFIRTDASCRPSQLLSNNTRC